MKGHEAPGLPRRFDWFDLAGALLLIASLVLVAAAPFGAKAFGDDEYHDQAIQLAAALKGKAPFSEVRFVKAPGPILFYTPAYAMVRVGATDREYWRAGVIWTAGWLVIALLLLRRVAAALAGPHAGLATMLLVLASPFSVYYSLGILAEGPAYVAVVVFLYGWTRAIAPGNSRRRLPHALMIGGLALLIMSRPNIAPMLGLIGLAWLVLRKRDRPAARLAASAGVGAAASLVCASAIIAMLPGQPGSAQRGGPVFELFDAAVVGRFQFRTETFDWRFWDGDSRGGSRDHADYTARMEQLQRDATARGIALTNPLRDWVIADTLAHPFLTVKMASVRVLSMHFSFVNSKLPDGFSIGPVNGTVIYWVFHAVVNIIGVGIAVLALMFLWERRGGLAEVWPLWAPWLALVAFHAIVYAEPRYLLPAKAAQSVMAGCALASLRARARHLPSHAAPAF